MHELAWGLVAVLTLVCVALAGLLWHRRHSRVPAAPSRPDAAATPSREARGPTPSTVSAVPGGGLAPLPGPAAPLRNPVAALVAPPVVRPPALLVAARSRRYELRDAATEPVVTLERGSGEEWRRAAVGSPTPMQCELLTAMLAHAPLLDGAGGEFYRLSLRAGVALPLARGELSTADLRVVPAQSLDPAKSPALAAIVMALHCAPVYLSRLRREVGAIQADAAGWLRRSSSADERLRALLQDLSRYLREVEENHAGAIRKPVFVARVADFGAQTEQQWRLALDAAISQRPGAGVGPNNEAAATEYAQRRRIAHCAVRMLAAWHGLRLALGDAEPAATLALRVALQSLRGADAADAAVQADGDAPGSERAQGALAATIQAIEAGFAGEVALTLLLRLDSLGRVLEVRGPVPAE